MSNYSDNVKAINQFRKELMAMLEDIKNIDNRVLNKAVNDGVQYAKRNTRVGEHPNPVTFTVKRGPDAGKVVSFKVGDPGVGGFLKDSWHKMRNIKSSAGVECELVNTAEYASFWNDGHRIVNKQGGETKGFVKGTYVLEKTGAYIEDRLVVLFEKEVREVQKEHDK